MDRPIDVVCRAVGFDERPRILGAGGEGFVFAVRSKRTGKKFALKMPTSSGLGTEVHEKLKRQVALQNKAAERTRYVPQVYHHNSLETPDGTGRIPYFLMQYAGERSLVGRRLSVAGVVHVGISLSRALHACHRSGIVHGDVKPANTSLDDQLHPYLFDFGAAHAPQIGYNFEGKGTIGYVAPEVLAKTQDHYTVSSPDMFSAGATLYELLAGKKPFSIPRYLTTTSALFHYKSFAERGTFVPLGEVDPSLPNKLTTLVDSMLQPDPLERPTSFLVVGRTLRDVERQYGLRKMTVYAEGDK